MCKFLTPSAASCLAGTTGGCVVGETEGERCGEVGGACCEGCSSIVAVVTVWSGEFCEDEGSTGDFCEGEEEVGD